MEVYLNVAETGIGTYGVNAGSQRYFNHDASAMSRVEAARIAAVLPLPKKRGATAPKGFTRRYGNAITARIGVVGREGLDRCVYEGEAAAPEREPVAPAKRKAAPRARAAPAPTVTLPGEEYEQLPAAPVAEPEAAPEPEPVPEANAQ
jgi:monofunctional biosynthetic peptidoglycan transglycosylase